MKILIRALNFLMAVLASCVLGLALYGTLRPQAADAVHPDQPAQQVHEEASPEEGGEAEDPWQQGSRLAEQGNWAAAIDDLEVALEQSPETPERYLLLAQACRETERDEDALEVLRRGMEATGSEELRLPLKAVESTLEMPEDQRTCLDALYRAFSSGDEATFSAALEDWENGLEVLDEEGNYIRNPLWAETGNLAWDGERFWADYTGNGLLLRGTGIFCGEISGNVPDGAGSCVAVHTWYPDSGGVGYLRLDGQWGERRGGGRSGVPRAMHRCRGHLYNVRYDGHAGRDGGRGDRPRRGHGAAASEWRRPYLPAHHPGRGHASGTLPQWRRILLRPLRLQGTSCGGRRFVFHALSESVPLGEGEPLSGAVAVPQLLL